MADHHKGFLKTKRESSEYRPVCERVKDYKEVFPLRSDEKNKEQASRCMDCGIPFCHWGCPVGNYIPEWNDLMFGGHWEKAFELLNASNPLPEITGRVCPALCEYACVLGINDDPVTVRENELAIIEHAFKKGIIKPRAPKKRTEKKVAVVGSGPAGLSCAAELNKLGHNVTVFEKEDKIGGLLRYGIPDFKLEKNIIDRRLEIWKKEGLEFKTNINAGADYSVKKLKKEFDAVCLAGGARIPRDLKIPGRELKGIYFAMEYLIQSNKKVQGTSSKGQEEINAKGKKVVVIGGGDTGADCVGTANRQGAACVVQIEVLPQPPECRDNKCPWPTYPLLLKTTSSHEEGVERSWSILTKEFIGENGAIKRLSCVKVEFESGKMKEVPGSGFEIEADLVLLAIGFILPEHNELLEKLKENFNPAAVVPAGDMRRGPSLVVWAIYEGLEAAKEIDRYLTKEQR